MIYTVTFNPSLDYVMVIPKLRLGEVCRTEGEKLYPGGKGINVSIVLSRLGMETHILGFAAGFTGEVLRRMLAAEGCAFDLIELPEGNTRINVKLKAQTESDLNAQGPDIPPESVEELIGKLDTLKEGDTLVLAGAIPRSMPEDVYDRILARLSGKGIRSVVDATGDLLKNALHHRPFLIKPNTAELGGLFDVPPPVREEIPMLARRAQALGARNVLVSMGKEGALLLTEEGRGLYGTTPRLSSPVVNSVGAGDSMVAGFLTGWSRTGDYEKALKLGIAAGSASVAQTWLPTREQVTKLLINPDDYKLQ